LSGLDLVLLKKLLTPQTILVSVTTADSETGTVQSVADIAGIIKDFRQKNNNSLPYFHTDASQADDGRRRPRRRGRPVGAASPLIARKKSRAATGE
jgi:hypothetical protein